jgi:hypothetical protein
MLGAALVLFILAVGGPFEKLIDRRWPARGPTDFELKASDKAQEPHAELPELLRKP